MSRFVVGIVPMVDLKYLAFPFGRTVLPPSVAHSADGPQSFSSTLTERLFHVQSAPAPSTNFGLASVRSESARVSYSDWPANCGGDSEAGLLVTAVSLNVPVTL